MHAFAPHLRSELELRAVRHLIRAVLIASTVVGAAEAADLESSRGGYGPRAGQIVFWDFEPGVVARAYWLPPYANRHFYPMSDTAPKVGRQENLSAPSNPTPAKSFYREWSSFAIEPEGASIGAPPVPPLRPADPTLK
jgi:hypothetical protein